MTDRLSLIRVNKALQLVQSTSPSYILLASLDAARQQMALHGKALMSRTLELADIARSRISSIAGLSILQLPNLDQTRLTVNVSGLGFTGFAAETILDEQLGVTPELASWQHLTFIITLGNTLADIEQLVQGFTSLGKMNHHCHRPSGKALIVGDNLTKVSPREAFFAVSEILPLAQTSDRICAEIVCPYPPGIPVLMPGELITPSALEYLQQVQAMGGLMTGCADPSLKNLKVVKNQCGT